MRFVPSTVFQSSSVVEWNGPADPVPAFATTMRNGPGRCGDCARRLDTRLVGHIAGDREHGGARVVDTQLVGDCRQPIDVARREDDVCSVGEQRPRAGQSDARATAGDQREVIGERLRVRAGVGHPVSVSSPSGTRRIGHSGRHVRPGTG